MNIAVTGASGHVGRNLCQLLIDKGHQVKALIHKDINGLQELQLNFINGDVTHEKDLDNLCSGCDLVFHLAASISIRKNDRICRKINIESCINLIKAARRQGIKRIIHFSSIHAFHHEPLDAEMTEIRELSLSSPVSYEYSKAMGQKIMLEASSGDLEVVVLNPTAIIGPNDFKPSLMGNALIRFYKGLNPVLIPGGYNWVDVRDVCISAISAIEHGVSGECYLIGGSWQSLRTVADGIEELGGKNAPRLEMPVWMAHLGAPFFNFRSMITGKAPLYTTVSLQTLTRSNRYISCEKAKAELGHNPRPFAETLSDTISWFRDNNYV